MRKCYELECRELFKNLNRLISFVIIARQNHFLLYDKEFFKLHFKTYFMVKRLRKEEKYKDLKRIPFFIWLYLFPVFIVLFVVSLFIALYILEKNSFTNSNLQTLMMFPPTLLLAYLFHKLSNYEVRKYMRKLRYNYEVLNK